jgi:hypothetical protein
MHRVAGPASSRALGFPLGVCGKPCFREGHVSGIEDQGLTATSIWTRVEPTTRGELVRAGVARAALLERLLRLPLVLETLDDLPDEPDLSDESDMSANLVEHALRRALLQDYARETRIQHLAAFTQSIRLGSFGPWLPEFLEAAWAFRRVVHDQDIGASALVDPSLAEARMAVRSWRESAERTPGMRYGFAMRLLAALVPRTDLSHRDGSPPDWARVFSALVEQACDRVGWTREATGSDKVWPLTLYGSFSNQVECGDDPEVVHALVDRWAATCHAIIEDHTRPSLPRGHIPDNGWPNSRYEMREGLRDKIRRWVGWYVDKEICEVPRIEILRIAFPQAEAPSERGSELNRHIREAKRLLALSLPLDPDQPLRLWRLLEMARPWLESERRG